MRSILILTCCLALASVAQADQNKRKNKPGNQAPVQQQPVQQQHLGKAGKQTMGAAGLNQQQQLQTNSQLRMQHKFSKTQGVNSQQLQTNSQLKTQNKALKTQSANLARSEE